MDPIIHFYIPMFVALFGIAYPIILQIIARLDEKYNSDNLPTLFFREPILKWFKNLLWIALIFVVLWFLQLSPIPPFDRGPHWIDHSATIFLSCSVLLLAVLFIFLMKKAYIYYNPPRLIKYLSKKHFKTSENKNGDYLYFTTLADILAISIKNEWEQNHLLLTDFFKKAFRHQREKQSNEPVEYPEAYYKAGFRIMEELSRKESGINPYLNEELSSINWLLREGTITRLKKDEPQSKFSFFFSRFKNKFLAARTDEFIPLEKAEWKTDRTHIHSQTYTWMWKHLRLLTEYKKDDILQNYWDKASRYFFMNFSVRTPDSSETDVTNKKELFGIIRKHWKGTLQYSSRIFKLQSSKLPDDDLNKKYNTEIHFEEERDEFRQINLALCILLVYHERYDLLNQIIRKKYDTTYPPTKILPGNMNEIFDWVIRVVGDDQKIRQAAFRYPLSYDDSIFTTEFFKNHLLKFLALIYLKQYARTSTPLSHPLEPDLPGYKEEIKKWKDGLPEFTASVSTLIFDPELLEKFGLGKALQIWNDQRNDWHPVNQLYKIENKLETLSEKSKTFNQLLEEKTELFRQETKEKLEDTLKSFHVLNLFSEPKDFPDSEKIRGEYAFIRKDPYIISYSHAPFFGTEIVEDLSETIKNTILSSFETSNTTRYLLKEDDIFLAGDRLGLTKDHIILVMGSLEIFKQKETVEGLSDDAYKKTPLYSFGPADLMGFHLYILKKEDLPYLKIESDPSRHITTESQLKISKDYHIDGTLLDLDDPSDINYEELQLSKEIYSRKHWLALSLDFEAEMIFNKKAEIIHLELYSLNSHPDKSTHRLQDIRSGFV